MKKYYSNLQNNTYSTMHEKMSTNHPNTLLMTEVWPNIFLVHGCMLFVKNDELLSLRNHDFPSQDSVF